MIKSKPMSIKEFDDYPRSLPNQIQQIKNDREFILDAAPQARISDLTLKVGAIQSRSLSGSLSQKDIAAIDELDKKKAAIEAMEKKQGTNLGKPYYESKSEAYIAMKRKEEKKQRGF